jgi:hypothetical protein
MQLKAFALLDSKTGMFNVPFFMAHTGQALRAVMELGQDLTTIVGRHPTDFVLYEIGTYDDQTGTLTSTPINSLGVVASLLPTVQGNLFRPADLPGASAPGESVQSGER